jgi:hypothetical protein
MSQVFIVGFGKFGQLALPKISKKWPEARIWIIDPAPENLVQCRKTPAIRVLDKGEDFLWNHREQLENSDWIIPAVPFHFAGAWVRRLLTRSLRVRKIAPPQLLGKDLPFTLYLKKDLYVSLADFTCPENCPSPQGFCFQTRVPRPQRLWEMLASRPVNRGSLQILESHQLAPGLGGFTFGELKRIEKNCFRSDPPLFLATACPCHGVISGFRWQPPPVSLDF